MSRPRIERRGAVFPPGYELGRLYRWLIYFPTTRSRCVRAFFRGLPYSRLRAFFVARYYHRLMGYMARGDFNFIQAVSPDAELAVFSLETFRGRDAWRKALSEWMTSLSGLRIEMAEFLDAGNHRDVLLTLRLTGSGSASGVSVRDEAFFLISVEDGMAIRGAFFREPEKALEAAGMSK